MADRDYKKAKVTAAYAAALVDYVRSRGLDPQKLYANSGLPDLESLAARGQISFRDWLKMFDIAADALGEPDLALKAGASIKIKHLGVLAQVIMNCATIGEAFLQLARYIRLLGEFGQPELKIHGDSAHLIWGWPYPSDPPVALVLFMQAARTSLVRWLTSRPDMVGDVYFYFPAPADTVIYKEIFGGKLFFGQATNKIVIPASYLQAPIVCADESWRKLAEIEASAVLHQLSGESELQQQLKKSLISKLELGCVSLDEAARELGMTSRTLQRKLDAEGQSFRRILDEVRLARAQNYLRDPKLSLADVTFLLGYAEQSAFQYAFKQWTGETPGEYRSHRHGRS